MALVSTAALVLPLSGCCGSCGDALQTPDGRKAFIDSLNQDTKACTLNSTRPDLTEITRTCGDTKIAEMIVEVEVMCDSYQILGFKKISLVGEDGKGECTVAEGCACKEAVKVP